MPPFKQGEAQSAGEGARRAGRERAGEQNRKQSPVSIGRCFPATQARRSMRVCLTCSQRFFGAHAHYTHSSERHAGRVSSMPWLSIAPRRWRCLLCVGPVAIATAHSSAATSTSERIGAEVGNGGGPDRTHGLCRQARRKAKRVRNRSEQGNNDPDRSAQARAPTTATSDNSSAPSTLASHAAMPQKELNWSSEMRS